MAIVQTAAYDAADRAPAASGRRGRRCGDGAAVDAAVAAAHRATLAKLLPAQQAGDRRGLPGGAGAPIADGAGQDRRHRRRRAGRGRGAGRSAPTTAPRAPETYRPHTTAGAYVPTATPAVPQWPQRKPWLMTSAAQFRPAPAAGADQRAPGRATTTRSRPLGGTDEHPAQRRADRDRALLGVLAAGDLPRRGALGGAARRAATWLRNARLYAAVAQAMDDALIGVFDAKYHYNFWRPVTAIRNGDIDGNDATAREPSWAPLIDTPMHPEYPSGHAILAAAVGAVLKAEVGNAPMPVLSTRSPTAKGATRRWIGVDDFVREVADARVWGGMHYRFSTEAGDRHGHADRRAGGGEAPRRAALRRRARAGAGGLQRRTRSSSAPASWSACASLSAAPSSRRVRRSSAPIAASMAASARAGRGPRRRLAAASDCLRTSGPHGR